MWGGGGGGGGGDMAVVFSGGEAAVRRRGRTGADADDGCSASSAGGGGGSSSGRGSFGPDSPLAGFVLAGDDGLGTDREQDGLPACAYSSNGSGASAEAHKEVLDGVKEEEWVQLQEPAKNPAVGTIGECQNQQCQLEAALFHGKKGWKQRPASLDFGSPSANAAVLSPGFLVGGVGVMNKESGVSSHIRSEMFPSPGTPSYRQQGASVVGYQNGWSSERVPLPLNGHRRYPGSSMAFPFTNGRTLPSKWEDAERWIISPNSHDTLGKTSQLQARRPKSKSGPLGPPGRFGAVCLSASSSASLLDNGMVGNFTVNSPFLAGVLIPEHVCGGSNSSGSDLGGAAGDGSSNGRGGRSCLANDGACAIPSARVRRQLDTAVELSPLLPSSQKSSQEEHEITEDSATIVNAIISRKDVATQTSPDLSRSSSPDMRPSFSRSLSAQQVKELESCFAKLEIKDVQMDDRVTLTRWSKKHVTRGSEKNSTNIIEWKKRTAEAKSSSWEVTETAKCISKIEGEELKVDAWENLQKAKAEAAIQKLVMKLEKKRSYSLDKIFSTFRSAQRKAQLMRSAATANQDQHISRTVKKTSQLNKNGQMSSLSGCFTCHAF